MHQLCARFEFGDAVSNHVLAIDRALASRGFETAIYANTLDGYGAQVALPDREYARFADSTDDLLIYHYSVYCPNYRDYLETRNRRMLVYHNITPPEFFRAYDVGVAEFCRMGRELLPRLSGCDLALGDSEYNRLELIAAGFDGERTGVLPVFVDYEDLLARRPGSAGRRQGDTFRVLFVGRAVPNKRIEDVVRAFLYYNRCINEASELFLVGASWVDRYDAQLRWLIDSCGLAGRVHVTGRVTDAELSSQYASADLFLSMSEHEGFGVPLVECMAFDVPVLAYAAAAVPHTLGGSGLTFSSKEFPRVGELMELVRTDRGLNASMRESQRARLASFAPEALEASLLSAVDTVLGGGR